MPTFDTPGPITATIDTSIGHVWIIASDRSDTVVEARPADASRKADVEAAEQTVVEYAGGRLTVKTPRGRFYPLVGPSARTPAVDVTVELPAGSRVDATAGAEIRGEGRIGDSTFKTAAGAIRLDRTGRLKLRTGLGDVSVAGADGNVDVSSASGKVWLGEIDGKVDAKSSNGAISVGEAAGDLWLKTAVGDITVDRALAAVSAKTAAGSVRVGELVRGSAVLETGYGEVEVGIAEGTAAWLDVSSNRGSVRSDLDAADEPAPSEETVEVRVRTGFGDILIHRS